MSLHLHLSSHALPFGNCGSIYAFPNHYALICLKYYLLKYCSCMDRIKKHPRLQDCNGSMAARSDLGLEPRTPKRQSFIRAVLSEKKRKPRNNLVLRPDPFRYGDPNPLDCHPYFSDRHPDYIVRPHTVQRPLSFPVFNPTPGSPRLSIYDKDDLDAYRSQGFVPRLLRVDSLVAILEFFDGNTLSRAMANSLQPARKPPETPCGQQKPPVNSLSLLPDFCFYSGIILYMN